jgi:hypothetical protein
MRRSICFLILVIGFSVRGPAEEKTLPAADSGDRITSISISGLKRTKYSTAERPLLRFIGKDASRLDIDEVYSVILDMGIFEVVSIKITGAADGKVLEVEVKEKWAIFPIPIFSISSGKIRGGAALYDANAFGINDKMALAGMYGSGSWMAMALYLSPPAGSGFGWTLSGGFSRDGREDTDQKNKVYRSFKLDSISAGSSLTYPLSELITASLRFSYINHSITEHIFAVRETNEKDRQQIVRMGPELGLRRSTWDGVFLSEESLTAAYFYSQGIDSPSFHTLQARLAYEKSFIPGFRAVIRSGGIYSPGTTALFESSPREAAVNILSPSYKARHLAGLSLGLEKKLITFPFGILSALAAWQQVYSSGPVMGNQFDYGVAVSAFVYLKRLAIPAMGGGLAYNVRARHWQSFFNMGMSF